MKLLDDAEALAEQTATLLSKMGPEMCPYCHLRAHADACPFPSILRVAPAVPVLYALRRGDVAGLPCWCAMADVPATVIEHTTACADARALFAVGEPAEGVKAD